MSSPAIQFKGSGWYITDYARKNSSDASKESGSKESTSDGKGDAKNEKADAKSEKADKDSSSKSDTAPASPTTPSKD
jgi:predicted nucleic acid-binding Zn ribbon protein